MRKTNMETTEEAQSYNAARAPAYYGSDSLPSLSSGVALQLTHVNAALHADDVAKSLLPAATA